MKTPFDPGRGLIVVSALVRGPRGSGVLQLAVDTGATATMINTVRLASLGYDPSASPERVAVTTASGVEYAPRLVLQRVRAVGRELAEFSAIAHTLPPSAGVDGLLGLDFFRGTTPTIDFRQSVIDVE